MLIFIPIFILCRAGHCRRGCQNRTAGLSVDSRTLWLLYQNVTAGLSLVVPFMDRIGRKINMTDKC